MSSSSRPISPHYDLFRGTDGVENRKVRGEVKSPKGLRRGRMIRGVVFGIRLRSLTHCYYSRYNNTSTEKKNEQLTNSFVRNDLPLDCEKRTQKEGRREFNGFVGPPNQVRFNWFHPPLHHRNPGKHRRVVVVYYNDCL